ncbi:MAG: DMT family transporter [Acidiferrobacteraceae bacterium]
MRGAACRDFICLGEGGFNLDTGGSRSTSRERVAATALLVVLGVIWGANWIVMKLALRDAGPFWFAAARSVLGGVSLLIAGALSGHGKRPPVGPTLALGLLQTSGFIGFSMLALVSGPAGQAVLLSYTMPFWTLVFGRIWLGEAIYGLRRFLVVLSLMGLLFIVWPALSGGGHPMSDVYAVLGAICWAASVIVAKRIPGDRSPMLEITAWQMLAGGVPLAVLARFSGEPPVRWNADFIGMLAYNALVSGALAWLFWFYIVRVLSATAASFGILLVPVIGAAASVLWLHERPGLFAGLGMGLICLALALLPFTKGASPPLSQAPE